MCLVVDDIVEVVPDLISYLLRYKTVLIFDTHEVSSNYIKSQASDTVKYFDNTYYIIENTAFGIFSSSNRIDYSKEDIDFVVDMISDTWIFDKKYLRIQTGKSNYLPSKKLTKTNGIYSCTLL